MARFDYYSCIKLFCQVCVGCTSLTAFSAWRLLLTVEFCLDDQAFLLSTEVWVNHSAGGQTAFGTFTHFIVCCGF